MLTSYMKNEGQCPPFLFILTVAIELCVSSAPKCTVYTIKPYFITDVISGIHGSYTLKKMIPLFQSCPPRAGLEEGSLLFHRRIKNR